MSENLPQTQPRQRAIVTDAEALYDTAQFEHMSRIASMMSRSSLIPDHLAVKVTEDGGLVPRNYSGKVFVDREATAANCFLIVNQARLFGGIDPFALAQVSYFVHGRLGFEGKLVQAVIERRIGVLRFEYFGTSGTPEYGITITGVQPGTDREVSISGTVLEWQTQKNGSINQQWQGPAGQHRMLHYRGTREWARLYAPGLVLGLLDDDDLDALREDHRANRARPVDQISAGPAQAQIPQRPFNPMEDPEDAGAEEPAKAEAPAEVPKAAEPEPKPPTPPVDKPAPAPAATTAPASSGPTVVDPAPKDGRRAPRGTPARVEKALMRYLEAKDRDAVEAVYEELVQPLLVEMKDLGVNFAEPAERLANAYALRMDALNVAQANPDTGEIGGDHNTEAQGPDFNGLLEEFKAGALTCQTFDALDTLVDDLLGDKELPVAVDAELDEVIEATRTRIASASQTQAPAKDALADDHFPGDPEGKLPPAQDDAPAQDPAPAAEPKPMSDEAIQETVDGWSTGMRKCKTSKDLEKYNEEVVTPFMQGPYGPRISKDQLEDARTTYKNRRNLLVSKEKDAAAAKA